MPASMTTLLAILLVTLVARILRNIGLLTLLFLIPQAFVGFGDVRVFCRVILRLPLLLRPFAQTSGRRNRGSMFGHVFSSVYGMTKT